MLQWLQKSSMACPEAAKIFCRKILAYVVYRVILNKKNTLPIVYGETCETRGFGLAVEAVPVGAYFPALRCPIAVLQFEILRSVYAVGSFCPRQPLISEFSDHLVLREKDRPASELGDNDRFPAGQARIYGSPPHGCGTGRRNRSDMKMVISSAMTRLTRKLFNFLVVGIDRRLIAPISVDKKRSG
jgi:hypothetical protein